MNQPTSRSNDSSSNGQASSTRRWRDAAQSQLDTGHWHSRVAITFTLKQAVERDGLLFWLTPEICTEEFRRFMQRLNRRVYGNANRRYGKRLRVVDVVEKDEGGRWHIHAVIELPSGMTKRQFREAINQCWLGWNARTMNVWAYQQNKIKFDADAGWERYLLKLRQKAGHEAWPDCIDWYSLYNPGC